MEETEGRTTTQVPGISAEMAGARLGAAFGGCTHLDVEPVRLSTGEVVATICASCLTRLPAAWGCQDCDYIEERMLCEPFGRRVLSNLCDRHQVGAG